tara:strand:+ start:6352 stop:7977 length:1626 start_codon:yes stop_codon:yes gene_type:complete
MAYQYPLKKSELQNKQVEFLLEITFGGQPFFWATSPLQLTTRDGDKIDFTGGLEINWANTVDLFSEAPSMVSQAVQVVFDVDVAELISKGHSLFNAKGVLSMWVKGRDYEERLVLLNGRVTDPEYGANGEPVSFSLEGDNFEDYALTPSDTHRISARTWGVHYEDVEGLYYPIVFGHPGVFSKENGDQTTCLASPAYVVDNTAPVDVIVLVAGHECEATRVTLHNITDETSAPMAVYSTNDGVGNAVTVGVYPHAAMGANFNEGDELFVTWDQGGSGADPTGGLLNEQKTASLRGAGEIIIHFLKLASIEIDFGRWRAVEEYLNQHFHFDGYIDEPVSPLEWLKQNVFGLLPISLVAAADGLAPILWRREQPIGEAATHLNNGVNASRVGPVLYEFQKLENNTRFDYALDTESTTFKRTMTLVGADRAANSTEISNTYSRTSHIIWGARQAAKSSDIVYEDATAAEILTWWSRARALPYRVIEYTTGVENAWLNEGDLVTLTDASIHLTLQKALVRSIKWENNQPTLVLVLVENPPSDTRI